MNAFQLPNKHYELIKAILGRHGLKAWVFGSRAKGKARKFSDLDLLIKEDIPNSVLSDINWEFEESDLPIKIDLARWSDLSPDFQKHIAGDLVEFK